MKKVQFEEGKEVIIQNDSALAPANPASKKASRGVLLRLDEKSCQHCYVLADRIERRVALNRIEFPYGDD
jgi:hypothetical protein